MAAPSGIVWGAEAGNTKWGTYGRIGIYTSLSNTDTQTTLTVQLWFWSRYSVDDESNSLYYNNRSSSGSATTLQERDSQRIKTTADSLDSGKWSTTNQVKIATYTHTYTRGTSDSTRYLYAKLANIDMVNATMYASATVKIPKLASYAVKYNANGGSGAPSGQTKWHGKTLTLSSTKPTRTGYSFQGWGTSASDTSVDYAAGASYTANAAVTLYAIWKANTYTVSYNANGGSGAPSSQTKTYGKTLTLSSTKPTRTNYNFKGWGTSASATTAAYAAGGSYTNNSAITLFAVWELAYTKPRITNLSVIRCDSSGTAKEDGQYAKVTCNWATDKTVSSIKVEWISSSNTGSKTITASGTSGSISEVFGANGLKTDVTYTIKLTVADASGSTSKSKTLASIKFVIDLLNGGTGVAFGKAAQTAGYADFGYDVLFDNQLHICGKDLSGNIKEAFQPQNENGDTVLGWGNYDKQAGNTNIYGYDIFWGVSNIAEPGTFRPYVRRGDSYSFTLRLAGYVTNGGQDVSFVVPMAVPILGAPTVTVESVNGFTLRQGGQYTHGSASSTYVNPDSYSATVAPRVGVYITAKFSNTTNVTNNDAIGIYWNGKITFS